MSSLFKVNVTQQVWSRDQADTIGSPQHVKERLSKRQLGRLISDYEAKYADRRCGNDYQVLKLAIQYARNIHEQMPDDPV